MIIGTLRPEEAKVFDGSAGYHQFTDEDTGELYGWFEVFWSDGDDLAPGWYWAPCQPGCLPEGEPVGPFGTSHAACRDADEEAFNRA